MLKQLLFVFISLFCFSVTEKCFAQIEIQNPSFEGPSSIYPPFSWDTCFGTVDTAPESFLPETFNLTASDGLTYAGMFVSSHPIPGYESTSQKLACGLRKNIIHKISFDLAFVRFNWFGYIPGQMGLYGGTNNCDTSELLWLSPPVDSLWTRYNIQFIPHENYQYISFCPYVQGPAHKSYVAIDNLSPFIEILNGGIVAAQINATEIYLGECVNLNAQVTDTSYTSVHWYSEPQGFYSNQLNAGSDCPKQDTKYIVAVSDTCGIMSYDTVTVKIKKPLLTNLYHHGYAGENYFMVKGIYPNTNLTIYNSLGQKLFQSSDYKNDFNVSQLPAAMYFYQLKTSTGEEQKGKFEVF